jgi:hypothetical protein
MKYQPLWPDPKDNISFDEYIGYIDSIFNDCIKNYTYSDECALLIKIEERVADHFGIDDIDELPIEVENFIMRKVNQIFNIGG